LFSDKFPKPANVFLNTATTAVIAILETEFQSTLDRLCAVSKIIFEAVFIQLLNSFLSFFSKYLLTYFFDLQVASKSTPFYFTRPGAALFLSPYGS